MNELLHNIKNVQVSPVYTVGIESLGTPGKICINVLNEAKERWKNLQKASNYRLDILIKCQQKVRFYFHHLHFQNYRKQKDCVCKSLGTLQNL